jgi:predicted SnoaL-like aldol condensation-catalyzing enzyme
MKNIKEAALNYVRENVANDYRVIRVLIDSNKVALHGVFSKSDEVYVSFDILEIKNEQFVKHIANVDKLVDEITPSGHTQIDGPIEIKNVDTETTRDVAVNAVNTMLVNGPDLTEIDSFFGNEYIQHHIGVPDGVETVKNGVTYLKKLGKESVYDSIYVAVAQGDFALLASKGHADGVEKMYYDLFRVENGLIVEHWDIVKQQEIGINF